MTMEMPNGVDLRNVPLGTVIGFGNGRKVGLMIRSRKYGGGWWVDIYRRDQVLDAEALLADLTFSVPGSTPTALVRLVDWRPILDSLTVRRSSDTEPAQPSSGSLAAEVKVAMESSEPEELVHIGPEGEEATGALYRVEGGWVSTFHRPRYTGDPAVGRLLGKYDVTLCHHPERIDGPATPFAP